MNQNSLHYLGTIVLLAFAILMGPDFMAEDNPMLEEEPDFVMTEGILRAKLDSTHYPVRVTADAEIAVARLTPENIYEIHFRELTHLASSMTEAQKEALKKETIQSVCANPESMDLLKRFVRGYRHQWTDRESWPIMTVEINEEVCRGLESAEESAR